MTKRSLTILIVTALLIGVSAVVIASSLGSGKTAPTGHVMPNGSAMHGASMDDMPPGMVHEGQPTAGTGTGRE